jgi:hypothetical protein
MSAIMLPGSTMHACSESSNQGSPTTGITKPILGWDSRLSSFSGILAINLSKTVNLDSRSIRNFIGFQIFVDM